MKKCDACSKRAKNWTGSDPQCAFSKETFDGGNWNCATLTALRTIAEALNTIQYMDDCSLATIPISGPDEEDSGWIVLSWYKQHGNTTTARFMIDDRDEILTLTIAKKAIKQHMHLIPEEGRACLQGASRGNIHGTKIDF